VELLSEPKACELKEAHWQGESRRNDEKRPKLWQIVINIGPAICLSLVWANRVPINIGTRIVTWPAMIHNVLQACVQ
jgi:hypothetical protein